MQKSSRLDALSADALKKASEEEKLIVISVGYYHVTGVMLWRRNLQQ